MDGYDEMGWNYVSESIVGAIMVIGLGSGLGTSRGPGCRDACMFCQVCRGFVSKIGWLRRVVVKVSADVGLLDSDEGFGLARR
ncbi:hypothetical protein EV363DRAFT_1394294 [Boletus edulis]|uniref:Uncharacterized protein n=1 Tax=Boletus edulis BED1 TaxID=1328754 RepID=A0AAD4BR56_BOLED|nr:hypothetical protein EV363DRAFT_1394294 [Boletus edulis]KAF8437199.1 hypothetical protein L210DRAFT_3547165 [Boletus edulis BED1]